MKDNIIKSCVKWKDNNNQIQLEKPDQDNDVIVVWL
jgi:hypothetical protein